jgi:phenylacetic acid degradation operon negative regulatory protein
MSENVMIRQAKNRLRPQALIFTLYGDYIHYHGDRIRISSLIKLLTLFGVSAQAVRTKVSRMARRGWLTIERSGNISYYAFTLKAQQTIEEGITRIFAVPSVPERWNRCWHLVTYSIPEEHREARDKFRRELGWLGYGMLTNAVWVSPRNRHSQVESLAAQLDIRPFVQMFSAESEGLMSNEELVTRCWNLGDLNAEYAAFLGKHATNFENCRAQIARGDRPDESECFVQRFLLVHEYRQFPYRDPYLPVELLPRDWRGMEAANLFRAYHELLADRANTYFESVYQ